MEWLITRDWHLHNLAMLFILDTRQITNKRTRSRLGIRLIQLLFPMPGRRAASTCSWDDADPRACPPRTGPPPLSPQVHAVVPAHSKAERDNEERASYAEAERERSLKFVRNWRRDRHCYSTQRETAATVSSSSVSDIQYTVKGVAPVVLKQSEAAVPQVVGTGSEVGRGP